jgi:hypothetical protein
MSRKQPRLSDEAAVKALSLVAQSWISKRGLESFGAYHEARSRCNNQFTSLPKWLTESPKATKESGKFARRMLGILADSQDEEVSQWTKDAIGKVSSAKGYAIDPLTLAIGGLILIGAILAARVRKIGSVTFYKGVPKELADVLKAGASLSGASAPSLPSLKGKRK